MTSILLHLPVPQLDLNSHQLYHTTVSLIKRCDVIVKVTPEQDHIPSTRSPRLLLRFKVQNMHHIELDSVACPLLD